MRFLVCLTAFLLLLKPLTPLLEYAVNYDYIANVLCVNKSRPELHCNGKCHLMQELAKASETEKPAAGHNSKKAFSAFELYCDTASPVICFDRAASVLKKQIFSYSADYSFSADYDIFHPPSGI